MGILDNVIGALGEQAGGGLADLVKAQGGVGGLVEKFGQSGLGDLAASWVGKGENLSITPEQIAGVIGQGPIADFARSLGVSPDQAAETIAGLLPEAIDRLTPNGMIEGLPGDVGDLLGGLLKR